MSQTFGMESPRRHPSVTHREPVRYVVVIDSGGLKIARLFQATRTLVAEVDAAVEEVGSMTAGLVPAAGALDAEWDDALAGHSVAERAAAQIYTLTI